MNKTKMVSGRAQKTHWRTSSSQGVLYDCWTRFGPCLATRRTRSTQTRKENSRLRSRPRLACHNPRPGHPGHVQESRHLNLPPVRPANDRCGFDLIAARSRSARLWYLDTGDAVDYAKHRSRWHRPINQVYDGAGSVIEAHEHTGELKEWW